MPQTEYLRMLQDYDHAIPTERLPGAGEDEVDPFAAGLEPLANMITVRYGSQVTIVTGGHGAHSAIQGDIIIPKEVAHSACDITIRVSRYGRFTTFFPLNEGYERLDSRDSEELIAMIDEAGFVYLPIRALVKPYSGTGRNDPTPASWWERYFERV